MPARRKGHGCKSRRTRFERRKGVSKDKNQLHLKALRTYVKRANDRDPSPGASPFHNVALKWKSADYDVEYKAPSHEMVKKTRSGQQYHIPVLPVRKIRKAVVFSKAVVWATPATATA